MMKRRLAPEEKDAIREHHREYLRIRAELMEVEGKILDLMDEREEVLRRMKEVSPTTVAKRFRVSNTEAQGALRLRSEFYGKHESDRRRLVAVPAGRGRRYS